MLTIKVQKITCMVIVNFPYIAKITFNKYTRILSFLKVGRGD